LFLVIAYNTGVRLSEVLGDNRKERLKEPLLWERIDRVAKRIYFPETKNGEARLVPFIGDMEEWIEMAWEDHEQNWPECPYVIQKHGKPVYDPRKAWNKACLTVGIPNLWRHDMRRSAVRNFDRSGVSSKIATAISGHKTRSVYDRYNIVADRDLSDAAQKMDVYLEAKREQAEKASSEPTQ
jgi:integrase